MLLRLPDRHHRPNPNAMIAANSSTGIRRILHQGPQTGHPSPNCKDRSQTRVVTIWRLMREGSRNSPIKSSVEGWKRKRSAYEKYNGNASVTKSANANGKQNRTG